jgi:hypothetical protein
MGTNDETATSSRRSAGHARANVRMQSGVRALEPAPIERRAAEVFRRFVARAVTVIRRSSTIRRHFHRWSVVVACVVALVGVVLAWPEPLPEFLGPCVSTTRFSVCFPDVLVLAWLALASTLITSAAALERRLRNISRERWGAEIRGHRLLSLDRLGGAMLLSALAILLVALGPWGLSASMFRGLLLASCFYYAGIGLSAMSVVYRQITAVCAKATGDELLFHADRLAGFSPLVRYADRSSFAILTGALVVPMAISIIQANLTTIASAPVRSYLDLALAFALLAVWGVVSFGVSLLGRVAISNRLGLLRDQVLWNVAVLKGQSQDSAALEALDRREKAAVNLQTGLISAGWWKDLLGMSGSAATALGWLLKQGGPHDWSLRSMIAFFDSLRHLPH